MSPILHLERKFSVSSIRYIRIILTLSYMPFFDFCTYLRLNGDSANFLFVGNNLCCFKQWRVGKLPIKFFFRQRVKMQKRKLFALMWKEREIAAEMQTMDFVLYTYHLFVVIVTLCKYTSCTLQPHLNEPLNMWYVMLEIHDF